MTADNLTFSVEIDFMPDITDGQEEFKQRMKDVAAKYNGSYNLDEKHRPIIGGLVKDDIEKVLKDLGLTAFGNWPTCILTCTISTPLPMRAVGMSDGWDIYIGKKTFFAFAQFPSDAVETMAKALSYYLEHEQYESLEDFVKKTGFENFRDEVLGNNIDGIPGSSGYDSAFTGNSSVPSLEQGDFIRPENNVMQIIQVYPEMGQFLMEYGMSCVGCFISYDENLWQAAQAHGMDVFDLLGQMNEYIADKYKKPLLTGDTPMETILTLYPQLLPIFKDAKIDMPSDMKTTIGTLCKEKNVDLKPFIARCDSRLRGEDA